MLFSLKRYLPIVLVLLTTWACSVADPEDVAPGELAEFRLNPDNIYIFNAGTSSAVRLDPLLNDSIKVALTITYSRPENGKIEFIDKEGWFYTPDVDFFGVDEIIYTGCYRTTCKSATIRMIVEEPFDPETCEFEINGEDIETPMDTPVEILIFGNDVICRYMGMSVFSPEHGTFNTYSYSGNYKNTVYIYQPPKGFTGTDRFKYRIFTETGFLETYCNITVK